MLPLRKLACVRLGAVFVCCAVAGACTPGDPAQSPTPSVSSSSPSPTPTESQQEREQRLAYEGAEDAYRSFTAEYSRLIRSTDQPRVTPAMKKYAAGPYLKAFDGFLKVRRDRHWKGGGETRIAYVNPKGYSPGEVLLTVCEDASKSFTLDQKGKVVSRGNIAVTVLTARPVDKQWKIWDGDQDKADSCDE